ncbi:MAG TPA: PLP-dependent aspartate aminotransferase family protein [Kofleriaceae bacterium]|jgi:cystathionine gamma-synthase|nr:PLP-dependent aspartate aminotransferase family protein [Kofleriaceae bacterium]
MKPETLAAQALHSIDQATGAIIPPIQLATTYARDANYATRGPSYTRDENPTPVTAERVIAALEGGAAARTFASGMAAATAVFRAVCRPGDHVITPRVAYYGLRGWIERFCARWGVTHDVVEMTDLAAVRGALRPTTRIVWLETPANPTWEITDIAAVAELAHQTGALVAVDSTCATPVHCQPIALGADLVMHAATKYLAGHSDVLAGVLVTARADAAWNEIVQLRHDEGACIGPFEAYLLLRGMRTLFARVERASRTAHYLAEELAARGVTVRYPGLPSHPQHAVAARQMQRGFGGMLSIQVGGGAARALDVVQRLRVWIPATSLGGVESLVEHRTTVEGPTSPTPPDLLRLSDGLEHEADLLDDLVAALS